MNRRQAIIAALLSCAGFPNEGEGAIDIEPYESAEYLGDKDTFSIELRVKQVKFIAKGRIVTIPVSDIFDALEVKTVSDKLPVLDPSKPPCGGHSEGGYWVWSRPDCGPPIPNQVISVVPKSHE